MDTSRMARKRRRKRPGGRFPSAASEIAWAFVRRHVPDRELRLIRVRAAWEEIATPRIASRTWPVYVKGDELIVAVQDNQWLHELAYLRQDLLGRVQRELPMLGIESLRLRLGTIPERDSLERVRPETPTRPEGLASEPPRETLDTLQGVSDPELRDAAAAARLMLGTKR